MEYQANQGGRKLLAVTAKLDCVTLSDSDFREMRRLLPFKVRFSTVNSA